MAAGDYYFFTDANAQGSHPAYLQQQGTGQPFGPITPGNGATDDYRLTSLHSATFDPTAYAVCDGIVCVQEVDSSRVNVILKPLVQPAINFVPVKYIIYKGILASTLINGAQVAAAANDLTTSIWNQHATVQAILTPVIGPPSKAVLGVTRTAAFDAQYADSEPIDNLFYDWGINPTQKFQLPPVNGGWSIGLFAKTEFGIEVLLDGIGVVHTVKSTRQIETKVSVPAVPLAPPAKELFERRHEKEQILGYMDPCAFYGSFFRTGVLAKSSDSSAFTRKQGNALYTDVLFAFANKDVAYLDIRNEHGLSLNYYGNYTDMIRITQDPGTMPLADATYYDDWPIMRLPAASFPAGDTVRARLPFRIELPVGDNPQPLLHVTQGYRDINRKSKGFPNELTAAEQFFDSFGTPVNGFTATKNSRRRSMTFVVPNVTGQAAATPVSCYIRLKYLKQQQGTTTVPTAIQSANHLDNLFYPVDLPILLAGPGKIKSAVCEDEVYVNARNVPGLDFDGMAKFGIARDPKNTSLFLTMTNIRKGAERSALVALAGEVSEYDSSFPNYVALKYPLVRVEASKPTLATAGVVPVARFVADGDAEAQERFDVPDFRCLFMVVVANAAYDSWTSRLAAAGAPLDRQFQIYLGVKALPADIDTDGTEYTPFELVLRGFAFDTGAGHYKVHEMKTDPIDTTTNIKVYAHAGN